MPSSEAILIDQCMKAWRFSCTLGQPQWMDDALAKSAAEALIRSRGPMRRVWAMVEVEGMA